MTFLKGISRADSSQAETPAQKLERKTRSALQRLRFGGGSPAASPEASLTSGGKGAAHEGAFNSHAKESKPSALAGLAGGAKVAEQPAASVPQYEILSSTLGSGSYGKVHRGRDRTTSRSVAIKCVADGRMRAGALEGEVAILQTLSAGDGHPNIVAFRTFLPLGSEGVCTEKGGRISEKLRNCHMVVMDACEGGEMFEHVVARGGISEEAAAPVVLQVCAALRHAHERGVAHRDIKLENILLARPHGGDDAPVLVKLIDWGLAHQHAMRPDGSVVAARLRSRCGSRSYMAPEVATRGASSVDTREGYCGFAADVWSVGVCLFAMLFGFFPFDTSDPAVDWRAKSVLDAQRRGESTVKTIFGFYEGKHCSAAPDVVALIDAALAFEPAHRPSLAQLLDSPWLARHCPDRPKPAGAAPIRAPMRDGFGVLGLRGEGERGALLSCPVAERQDSQSTVRSDRSTASSISSVSSAACPAHTAVQPTCSFAVAGGARRPEAELKYATRWRLSSAKRKSSGGQTEE